MRGRVMKVRTSITEPGVSIAWSWNLFSMKRSGSRRSFAATIARESREDHLSRVRFRDSGRRMAWLCHSKLRLGSAIKPAARMRRHDPPERLFTVFREARIVRPPAGSTGKQFSVAAFQPLVAQLEGGWLPVWSQG